MQHYLKIQMTCDLDAVQIKQWCLGRVQHCKNVEAMQIGYRSHCGAWPGLEIATDTVANATNIWSLATKNSDLVAKMATRFSVLMKNKGHFMKYFALLKNCMGRPSLKKHYQQNKKRSRAGIHPFALFVKDSLKTSQWLALFAVAQ